MCPTDMYGGTYTIRPGDTLSTYNMNTTGTAWSDNLATADSSGIIYYVGNGFAQPATQATLGNLQIKIMSAGTLKCTFTPNL
jgi:TRAP-type mannitol/chloroaromatic compound transport system substrate-binding protein